MLPSITLSALNWIVPGGKPLFSDLDLHFGRGKAGLIGRNGVGKSTLLQLIAGRLTPHGGTIRTYGTIAMLEQMPNVSADRQIVDLFGVRKAFDVLQRVLSGQLDEAETDAPDTIDWGLVGRINSALRCQGIEADPCLPLDRLSGGERTRVGLAALAFQAPDFLLMDEPTNNLDREGREAVIQMLRHWRGGAIVVSHDRELLDQMDAIVELTTLGATRFGGAYTAYCNAKAMRLEQAAGNLARAQKQLSEQQRKVQIAVERKARKDSAGRKKRCRNDQPKILLNAARGRSEATSAAQAHIHHNRLAAVEQIVTDAYRQVEILQPIQMEIAPVHLPADRTVLEVQGLSGGYDPSEPVIRDFSLKITGPERVALAGANGTGKTTLLRLLTGALTPSSGSVRYGGQYAFLDQHVSILHPSETIYENYRRMHPAADENACRAALARFLFRGNAALQTVQTLSGGERLRAGLACVLGGENPPILLMLDEPTNHLDLETTEALEAALKAYRGALLVVSHDARFLEAAGPFRMEKYRRSSFGSQPII